MENKEIKDLIIAWFAHIEQMATDRKTLNGAVMDYQECLNEIKCLARDSKMYINKYFKE